MADFIVERTPKGFDTFKMIKPIFRKAKKVKVSKNDFFNFSANCLRKEKKYTICPSIDGLSMDTYLKEKAFYNNKHFFSDFNTRTTWFFDIANEEVEVVEYDEEDEKIYLVHLTGKVRVYLPDGNLLFEMDNFKFNYANFFKYSKRYVELLLQNACNGIYQSARDIDEIHKELYASANKDLPIWGCDTCNETFNNVDEFYCHLIEEGHNDGIFTSHPFDKEAQRVKQLVANKIARMKESAE